MLHTINKKIIKFEKYFIRVITGNLFAYLKKGEMNKKRNF